MIGLDTNVLVRFLVGDDREQYAQSTEVMKNLTTERPGFICREVTMELVWVLERAYKFERAQIAMAVDRLLEAQELVIEAAEQVAIAINRYKAGGAGFADQIVGLAGRANGCTHTVTFDRKASALPDMRLVGSESSH